MAFVDRVVLHVKAGSGGPGASSFRREKFVDRGGPDGGNGGKGGNVKFIVNPNMRSLLDFKLKPYYVAKNGEKGKPKNQFGKDGQDLVLPVPLGTLIFDETGELLLADLCDFHSEFTAAKGGLGGKGNSQFSSSVNRSPRYAQSGLPGEERYFVLELRLIAEVGLVGLPNAGKSTLLKALTSANPKIANYPFTTLFPNLGHLKRYDREIIIADIPGLIEGASSGHGLGHDFLRHIDRTKVLIHLVPYEDSPEASFSHYQTILKELSESPFDLLKKPIMTCLSKVDMATSDDWMTHVSFFKERGVVITPISSVSRHGLETLIQEILNATSPSQNL